MKFHYLLLTIFLSFHFLVIEIFSQPNTLWTRILGGPNEDIVRDVRQTPDGGFILVGSTKSFGAGESDIWLVKINSSGDTEWAKTYGGLGNDSGGALDLTSDGNLIITGGNDNADVWLLKINNFGDTLWTKSYDSGQSEAALTVKQTIDGGYIIGGYKFHVNQDTSYIWLIKTTALGDTLWTKQFSGNIHETAVQEFIQNTIDSGYVLLGSKEYSANQVLLLKLDDYGDTIWTRSFGSHISDFRRCLKRTADGGFLLGLNLDSSFCLYKLTNYGDSLWTKKFDWDRDREGIICLDTTSDGGFILGGYRSRPWNEQYYLIKIDANGNTNWVKPMSEVPISVHQNFDGGYIVSTSRGTSGEIGLIRLTPEVSNIDHLDASIQNVGYTLLQNYPNPFNPATTIKFEIHQSNKVTLKIFNLLGEQVAILVSDRLPAGSYSYKWSRPDRIASGIYLYCLEIGKYVKTRKMLLLR